MSSNKLNASSQESSEKTVILQAKPNNNLVTWLKFIKVHAVTEYGATGKMLRTLAELQIPQPQVPVILEGQHLTRIQEMEYANALRNYDSQVMIHNERKIKLFAKIMSFTSLASRATIEAQPTFETVQEDSDVIGLMTIITDTHRPYAGLDTLSRKTALQHELTDLRQAPDQATAAYCQLWREKVRLALEAGVDLTNEPYYANIFINSLNSHHAAYRQQILDPTLNHGQYPTTIEEAICLIEKHEAFKQDSQRHMQANRKASAQQPKAVVAAAQTATQPGKGKKGKRKDSQPSGSSGTNGNGRPKRPPCTHCARLNPNHDPNMCFEKPGNEHLKAAHYDKRGAANREKRTRIKNAMLAALSDLFLEEQP